MADTNRLSALTATVNRSGAKLVLIGDAAQLPSIGAGGMFARLARLAPHAELKTVHRTSDHSERRAWSDLRAGRTDRAMAHYQARGRLHIAPTRDDAVERAVQTWARLTRDRPVETVALLTDASNVEIDRLNARAQALRAERGDLGREAMPFPAPTTRSATATGSPRSNNTTRPKVPGSRTAAAARSSSSTRTRTASSSGSTAPDAKRPSPAMTSPSFASATPSTSTGPKARPFDRALVLTGGWQTSRETSYVEASRARHGTDWYVNREELGAEGHDPERIARLAAKMRDSRVQTPSLSHRELPAIDRQPSRDRPRLLGRGRTLSDLTRRLRPSRDVRPDRGR